MAPVVGFYSYAREDDALTSGAVSELHGLLEGRIRLRLPGFSLFQDQRDIEPGDVWAERLRTHLDAAVFFFPVLTPHFFERPWCRSEAAHFLDRLDGPTSRLNVIPLYVVEDQDFELPALREEDPLRERLATLQFVSLREHVAGRWQGPAAVTAIEKVAERVAKLATHADTQRRIAARVNPLIAAGKLEEAERRLRENRQEREADEVARVQALGVYERIGEAEGRAGGLLGAGWVAYAALLRGRVEAERAEGARVAAEQAAAATLAAAKAAAERAAAEKAAAEKAAVSRPGARRVVRLAGVDLDVAYIPAGTFRMGSPEGVGESYERPQHEVRLTRPYWMGVYPVTQALWAAVATQAKLPPKPSRFEGDQRPVERVSWFDAVRWCNAASQLAHLGQVYRIGEGDSPTVENVAGATGFRLPTEAEWEYACRAGTTTRWSFGEDEGRLPEHGWFDGNGAGQTHPVGEKAANPWGLHDLHGSVWEWCDDGVRGYAAALAVDPAGARADRRVVRGGSWNYSADRCRCAFRSMRNPGSRNENQGFRVVLAAPVP